MITWISSYPKSGNTWFRIFLANLLGDGRVPADINRLGVKNFDSRKIFDAILGWETSDFTADEIDDARLRVQECLAAKGRSFFKVHDAFRHPVSGKPLFAAGASKGAIYLVRNPLDVAVSLANHLGKGVEHAVSVMNQKHAVIGQAGQFMQPMGSWSGHVRSWTEQKEVPLQVVRYEDLLADPVAAFGACCAFAGLEFSPARIARAVECSRFEIVKAQEEITGFEEAPPGCKNFFRQGRAGGWRELLPVPLAESLAAEHADIMRRFGYDVSR